MLRLSDVTEERTGGRSEELEQENKVESLTTDERPPQVREEMQQTNTNIEKAEPLQTDRVETLAVVHSSITTIVQQADKTLRRPRNAERGRSRLFRRFRKAVTRFFTRDLPLLRSPESIRAMSWRERANLYLSNPEESHVGWRLQQFLMLVLFVNIAAMAAETVDGPRFGSSDPDYPYMPGDSVFNAVEALFSLVYVGEFAVRWSSAPNPSQFWKSVPTLITFLAAIAALPKLAVLAMGTDAQLANTFMYNVRIFRAVRLIFLVHPYVGTKVLRRAVTAAIPPLTITVRTLPPSLLKVSCSLC